MTIYILKAYPDEHKWEPDSWVIGYFTSKAKLLKTIKSHSAELSVYNCEGFREECKAFRNGRELFPSEISCFLETGYIECVDANTELE